MGKVGNAIGLVFLLGLLVLVGWGVWTVGHWLVSLDAAYLGPALAAVFGFVGILYSQWHSKGREIAESHRPKKIEVYTNFFAILDKTMNNPDQLKGIEQGNIPPDIKALYWRVKEGIIVWGSPRVMKQWLRFQRLAKTGENPVLVMDDVLMAIRRDLGNSNIGLSRGDAVKMFLKDPDELDRILRK